MANTGLITDLSAIGTIDRTADVLEIVDVSANTSFKVTPNNLVGITGGTVLSTTDTQTASNKTFDNSNTYTAKDGSLTLQNTADPTKQAVFSLSGNTTGTTRIYTLPNYSATVATLSGTETFTNKTLTSPTITGGTMDNTSVTVDSISGHTSSNVGTIYGVSFNAGTLTGLANNTIAAANLATTAITLGYVQITSNVGSLTSTTGQQVTGLSVAVTIPAGGRRVKITAFCSNTSNASGSQQSNTLQIWDGVVGSGTLLNASVSKNFAANDITPGMTVIASVVPAAGSKTYNVGLAVSGGTGTVNAGTTSPAFILVEAI